MPHRPPRKTPNRRRRRDLRSGVYSRLPHGLVGGPRRREEFRRRRRREPVSRERRPLTAPSLLSHRGASSLLAVPRVLSTPRLRPPKFENRPCLPANFLSHNILRLLSVSDGRGCSATSARSRSPGVGQKSFMYSHFNPDCEIVSQDHVIGVSCANPGGLPLEVFDGIRAGVAADRSQFFKDLTTPFYGANRPGPEDQPRHPRRVLVSGHALRKTPGPSNRRNRRLDARSRVISFAPTSASATSRTIIIRDDHCR
jgi:hypothetical protein